MPPTIFGTSSGISPVGNRIIQRNMDRIRQLRGFQPGNQTFNVPPDFTGGATLRPEQQLGAPVQSAANVLQTNQNAAPAQVQSAPRPVFNNRVLTPQPNVIANRENMPTANEIANLDLGPLNRGRSQPAESPPPQVGTEGLRDIVKAGGLTPNQRSVLQADANRRLGASINAAQQALNKRFASRGLEGTGVTDAAFQDVLGKFADASAAVGLDIDKKSLDVFFRALSQLSEQEQRTELTRLQAQLAEEARAKAREEARGGLAGFLGDIAGLFLGGLGGSLAENLAGKIIPATN